MFKFSRLWRLAAALLWFEEKNLGRGHWSPSVTGGGAGGKGFALGLGCLVMEVEGRCTLGSAKRNKAKEQHLKTPSAQKKKSHMS